MAEQKTSAGHKVLVGCIAAVTADFCVGQFMEAFNSQDHKDAELVFVDLTSDAKFAEKLKATGKDVLQVNNADPKDAALAAKNRLRKTALEGGYSHLLLVELNIMLPKNAISRLLYHNKDIVAATYIIGTKLEGKFEIMPALYDFAGEDAVRAMELREILNDQLIEVSCAGMGCMMISRAALDKAEFRFFNAANKTGENVAFSVDARKNGFKTFADTGVKCNQVVRTGNDRLNDLFSFDAYPKIRNPRILVGCVTYDKDDQYLPGFLDVIRSQDYRNFDILFVDTSDGDEYLAKLKGTGAIALRADVKGADHFIKKIVAGRKAVRKYALEKGYDYLFFVDTDVRPPKTALSKLLSARKDMITGIYLMNSNINGTRRIMASLYDFDDEEGYCRPVFMNDALNNDMKEISAAGFGCTLMTDAVLRKVEIRYYEKSMAGEDIAFYVDARAAGFRTFSDNSVKCAHVVYTPGDPRNRKFMFETYEKGENYSIKVDGVATD
jgi:hypothetical protein